MFKTLNDYKDDKDKKKKKKGDEEEKKDVDWYAGGTSSGMAVSNGGDVDKIVSKAKENTSSGSGPGKEGIQLKISLYENGFVVDEGEFRDYEGDQNKQFIKELSEGYVPRELQTKFKGKQVDVSLEDKRTEKYRPPTPPPYVAYQGPGTSLGGADGVGLAVNKETGMPTIDDSQPTTKIQFRFHNGEKQAVTFNITHTIGDIHLYIMMAAPVDGSYELMSGFPPKPLGDQSLTIEEAGLKGAAITQKIL